MTKKSNSIMTSAFVTLSVLLLLVVGSSAVTTGTLFFNVTYNNGLGSIVTLNASNPSGTLLGGSTVAMNFTFNDTVNSTNFYNITFSSSLSGLTLPPSGTNVTSNFIQNSLTGGGSTGYINVTNTTGIAFNTQTFINITNIGIPPVTNNSANNTLIITVTTGTLGGFGYGSTAGPVTITYKFDIVNNVNSAQSTLTTVSTKAVANNTDKFQMNLISRDVNGNVINGATFNLVSNRTQDTITPSTVTTDATGNATFNVTSTLAGLAMITANGTNLGNANLTNSNVVFISGPAVQLAIFGPNSVTGVATLNQTVAMQDANGNNVTADRLSAYNLLASITSGSASITSTNPLILTSANASNVSALGVPYTATYNSAFTITAASVGAGAVTLQVTSNGSITGTSKTVTFNGAINSLGITTNKTSMNANNGNDSVLVTVQIKDASGNNIQTSGVTIQLSSLTPALFNNTDIGATNSTNANGIATFVVRSSTQSGSGTISGTVTFNPAGGTGQTGSSPTVTLNQAPSLTNSVVVNSTSGVILTGSNSTITATIKDYNGAGAAISGQSVTFNITTGDATFTDGTKLNTVNTVSSGNASVTITSTNASTSNSISVNVTIVDEKGVTRQISGAPQNFTVKPGQAAKFIILPGRNIGMTNVLGTPKVITINVTDGVGNLNLTASGTINITTNNPSLGNMSNGTATVTNNLAVTLTNGNASFTYTVNSSTPGTAILLLNSSLGINDTITITTSGAQGIALTVNKTVQTVGSAILASAQLTDASGNALGISGTTISFVVKNATNVLQSVSANATNASGIATFNVTQSVAGIYTVTASNGTLSNTTTVTFAGPAASIAVTANNTSPLVNQTVTINATVNDANGVTSGTLDTVTTGISMSFLANGTSFASATIKNGVASTTYTQATAGAVTITAFFNASLQGSTTVTFGTGPTLSVSATPTIVTVGTPTTVTFTVTSNGTAVSGATVTLSGNASGSGATDANGTTVISVNATGAGAITATATMTGFTNGTATVTAAIRTLSVSASPTTVIVGTRTNVTFTVTSNGTAVSGATVTLSGNASGSGATDANGTTVISVNATGAGAITATATMAGFTSNSTTIIAVIGTLSVFASPTTVTVGTPTTVTFTVTSNGTAVSGATVTLSGNASGSGTTDANGTTVISVNATGAGAITATASKTGFTSGTATVTAVIGTLSVSASPTTVRVGIPANVTFNVTSNGTAVSGATVTLSGNASGSGTTDANGTTVISVNATGAGNITATASKTGFTSGSTTISAILLPLSITTSRPSDAIVIVGTPTSVTLSVTTSGTPVPGVNVTLSGAGVNTSATTDTRGLATFSSVNATSPGTITATATMTGFASSTTTLTADIGRLSVSASPTTVTVGIPANVTFNVTSNGTAVSGVTVNLSGAGVNTSGTTNASGIAVISVNATSTGTITATATKTDFANGTTSISAVFSTLSVSASQSPVIVGTPTNVTFTVTRIDNGSTVSGARVTLVGNATGNGTTDANGSAVISVNATGAGNITAFATMAGFTSNSTTIIAVIGTLSVSASPTTVTVGIPANVTFTVTSSSTAVANATVTLSGNATGSGTTDVNGSATISVNATGAGTITATASMTGFASGSTTITAIVSVEPNDTIGVYRNGVFFLRNSNTAGFADITFGYGVPGDTPITGDWNADGITKVGVFRGIGGGGVFFLRNETGATTAFGYGLATDTPITGDWNADGITKVGVFRNIGGGGVFFLRDEAGNTTAFGYGLGTDTPITGDWNGDGITKVGVFRNIGGGGVFFLRDEAGNTTAFGYGLATDTPITGDWNGDDITKVGVFRNIGGAGVFFLRNETGATTAFGYGLGTDTPVTGNWVGNK